MRDGNSAWRRTRIALRGLPEPPNEGGARGAKGDNAGLMHPTLPAMPETTTPADTPVDVAPAAAAETAVTAGAAPLVEIHVEAHVEALAQAQAEPGAERLAEPGSAVGNTGEAQAPASVQTSDSSSAAASAAPAAPAELSPAACGARLAELFPLLFGKQRVLPIKLRIQADIQQRAPGIFTRKSLSVFLHRHTTSTAYLIGLTQAPHRFDLDGAAAGELSDEHRAAAGEELQRRRALHEARRAAENAALQTQRAAAQRERAAEDGARRERALLLRAFETTTLTPANFCALKGLAEEPLQATLALARQERAQQPPAERASAPHLQAQRRGERGAERGSERRGEHSRAPQQTHMNAHLNANPNPGAHPGAHEREAERQRRPRRHPPARAGGPGGPGRG